MSRTSNVGFVYRQYTKDGIFMADYKSSREAAEAAGTPDGSGGNGDLPVQFHRSRQPCYRHQPAQSFLRAERSTEDCGRVPLDAEGGVRGKRNKNDWEGSRPWEGSRLIPCEIHRAGAEKIICARLFTYKVTDS